MDRDPRIDPVPGDVIQQSSGLRLLVTDVSGDRVSWTQSNYGKWIKDNSWSINGWRNTVAENATVLITQPTRRGE